MNQYNNGNSNRSSSFSDSNLGIDSDGEYGTEDSDEEPEEDEEESDGGTTQALVDHVESSFLVLLDQTVERVEKSHDIHREVQTNSKSLMSTYQLRLPTIKKSRDEETQTDASFSPEHVINHTIGEAEDIRHEISSLRLARDALVNQRKEVADRVKNGSSGDHRADEKKIYEYEEAIEAIDSVVEFKNEIICGRECILSNCNAPGQTEADLVTRLTNLTTLDLQRLLWKYFSKVVELRYSSKRLEKQMDELESNYERLGMSYHRNQKQMKEISTEYESRIKLIIGLYNKDANSALDEYLCHLEHELSAAKKKQHDLEKSLTQLLVRHGYLTNGQDYDVKRIVKNLAIDTVQAGLNWKPESKPKRRGEQANEIPSDIRQALESGIGIQGFSRRMREAYGHRRQPSNRNHHPSHGSHNNHHHQHHHGQTHGLRETGPLDGQDFHHLPPQPPEVKRIKQKIIIQPRSASPDPP